MPLGLGAVLESLNIIGAIIWLGGTIAIAAFFSPVLRSKITDQGERVKIMLALMYRFNPYSWAALLTFALTTIIIVVTTVAPKYDFSSIKGVAAAFVVAPVVLTVVFDYIHSRIVGERVKAVVKNGVLERPVGGKYRVYSRWLISLARLEVLLALFAIIIMRFLLSA